VKFVLALITLLSVVAHADDLVFKKQMPNKQSVIVTRTEIPKNNELSPQQKAANAKWLKDNPGYFLGPTSDHRYRYTYSLTFADGKHQVLWTNEAETFGEAPPPGQIRVGSSEAQVLDVAVEESKNEHSTIGNDKTLVGPPMGPLTSSFRHPTQDKIMHRRPQMFSTIMLSRK
jgi:hypothetical protein